LSSQWSGIILNRPERRNSRQLFLQEKSWLLSSGIVTRVILVDVMPIGATINSEAYISTLNKLKKRFQRVRPGKNPAELLFQHDNARSHTSLRTRGHITKMG
jgi:hypothetical protein